MEGDPLQDSSNQEVNTDKGGSGQVWLVTMMILTLVRVTLYSLHSPTFGLHDNLAMKPSSHRWGSRWPSKQAVGEGQGVCMIQCHPRGQNVNTSPTDLQRVLLFLPNSCHFRWDYPFKYLGMNSYTLVFCPGDMNTSLQYFSSSQGFTTLVIFIIG